MACRFFTSAVLAAATITIQCNKQILLVNFINKLFPAINAAAETMIVIVQSAGTIAVCAIVVVF